MDAKQEAYTRLRIATEKRREAVEARNEADVALDEATVEWAEARSAYYRHCGLER